MQLINQFSFNLVLKGLLRLLTCSAASVYLCNLCSHIFYVKSAYVILVIVFTRPHSYGVTRDLNINFIFRLQPSTLSTSYYQLPVINVTLIHNLIVETASSSSRRLGVEATLREGTSPCLWVLVLEACRSSPQPRHRWYVVHKGLLYGYHSTWS